MNKKERLEAIIAHYSDSKPSVFAKFIGVAPSTISSWLARNTIDYDLIFAKCEDISAEWLLTGKGSMYKEDSLIPTNSSDGIPLIPTEAMAGLFAGSQTVMLSECERFIVPSFRNADFLITVRGDSMQPHYFSGDLVACKMLSLTDIFFQWGKVYVIDTEQGALIKKIEQGSTPETILLVSANPAYKPFEISRSSVYHIAIVQGVIREE